MGCGTSQLLNDVQQPKEKKVEAPPLTLKDRLGAIEPNWLDWAPAELDSLGREVLMGFFKRVPESMEFFHFASGQPLDALDRNPSFRIHATLLTRTVSRALTAIHEDRIDECTRELQDIGRRHGTLGAKPQHFASMGDSLMEALQKRFGTRWTSDTEATWKELYALISKNLRVGLKSALPKPPPPTLAVAIADAKDTWELLKADIEGNGAKVYFGMFNTSPAIKVLFPFTHDEQFRKLGLADPRLRNHSATVMIAVGSVITGMNDDVKAMKNTLKSLGASHGHLGVKTDMMDHLGASLVSVMEELVGDDKWTPELEASWEKVVSEVAVAFNSGIDLWRKGGAPNAAVAGCKPALGTTMIW